MKRLMLLLVLTAGPAFADGHAGPDSGGAAGGGAGGGAGGDTARGLDLLGQGSRLLMQGLVDQIEPDLRALAEEIGPALLQLHALIGDLTRYHAPEMLPNGDIILRRKAPLVPVAPGGEIEL